MNADEICTVLCNGSQFEGWTSVVVRRSVEEAAGEFELTIAERGEGLPQFMSWPIMQGDEITIMFGGEVALVGYVDQRESAIDAESHAVRIVGRSKTANAVDSSVNFTGGQLRDYKLDEIARKAVESLDLQVKIEGDVGEPFHNVQIVQGEPVFDLIDRLAWLRGFNVTHDEGGALVLFKGEGMAGGGGRVAIGYNVKSAIGTLRDRRYKEYIGKFQMEGTDSTYGKDVAQVVAKAQDSGAKRPRVLISVGEHPGNPQDAQERVNKEMMRRAAESAEATVTVYGWFGDGGLWKLRQMVSAELPELLISQQMTVAEITYKQSNGDGTTTEMRLVSPQSLAGPGGGSNAGQIGGTGPFEDVMPRSGASGQ